MSPSEVVRVALKAHLDARKPAENCPEIAQRLGIIGCLKGLPPDLSTNPAYIEVFGE